MTGMQMVEPIFRHASSLGGHEAIGVAILTQRLQNMVDAA
jgi:hypothetical protein